MSHKRPYAMKYEKLTRVIVRPKWNEISLKEEERQEVEKIVFNERNFSMK